MSADGAGESVTGPSAARLEESMDGQYTLEDERRLVRKVDWILMPILTVTLGLQYYDKAVLGSAAVYGIIEDLDLSQTINGVTYTTRYSTATAAFYYGYIVAVLPFALLFARLPLAKTAGVIVLIWGIVCILTVVCDNYPGFVVQRIFLGLMESAVSPAFVAITALWYKPKEQAARLGIWYSATGIFSMFSGVVNFGLGHANMAQPWKALYYFCGSVTIAWALVIYFFLPNSPLDPGRFFNARERAILVRRFEENPYGRDRQPLKMNQVKEAVLDFKTWLYFLIATAIYICNGSITAFGARIIKSLGYSGLNSVALLIPGGFVTCLTIYLFTWPVSRTHNKRTYLLCLSCIPVCVGAITIWTAPWHPTVGPLMGYYLVASFGAPYVLLLSLAAANVSGSTKKAITSGAIFIGYNVGNIASSYLVFTEERPVKYRSTWISVLVGMVFTILATLFLRFWYIRENTRRDELAEQARQSVQSSRRGSQDKLDDVGERDGCIVEKLSEYRDLSDKERRDFRYVY